MKKINNIKDTNGDLAIINNSCYMDNELYGNYDVYGANESLNHLSVPLLLNKGMSSSFSDLSTPLREVSAQDINLHSDPTNMPDGMTNALGQMFTFRPIVNDNPVDYQTQIYFAPYSDSAYIRFITNASGSNKNIGQWYKLNTSDKIPKKLFASVSTNYPVLKFTYTEDSTEYTKIVETGASIISYTFVQTPTEFTLYSNVKFGTPVTYNSICKDGTALSEKVGLASLIFNKDFSSFTVSESLFKAFYGIAPYVFGSTPNLNYTPESRKAIIPIENLCMYSGNTTNKLLTTDSGELILTSVYDMSATYWNSPTVNNVAMNFTDHSYTCDGFSGEWHVKLNTGKYIQV